MTAEKWPDWLEHAMEGMTGPEKARAINRYKGTLHYQMHALVDALGDLKSAIAEAMREHPKTTWFFAITLLLIVFWP